MVVLFFMSIACLMHWLFNGNMNMKYEYVIRNMKIFLSQKIDKECLMFHEYREKEKILYTKFWSIGQGNGSGKIIAL